MLSFPIRMSHFNEIKLCNFNFNFNILRVVKIKIISMVINQMSRFNMVFDKYILLKYPSNIF